MIRGRDRTHREAAPGQKGQQHTLSRHHDFSFWLRRDN